MKMLTLGSLSETIPPGPYLHLKCARLKMYMSLSTDGDDNNDSYDHWRKKVKSASEDVRCTRARRQRGSSGSKKKQELLQEEVSKDEKSEDEQNDATSAREDDDNEDGEREDD
ncbi:hypothetical protein VaNZ11_008670 [Volvox africanus]|uniref:Uncharacterized protein n=1 Tax=Volvox africanus TaxID=51714 RepID=A0ABQ5S6A7_9CHLO|nr:hypothetical protein VaNZ11_008670 [Volvox africanus]